MLQPQAGVSLVSRSCFVHNLCMHVFVCLPPRLLITSSGVQIQCKWLNKLYSFCVGAEVDHGLSINMHYRNQWKRNKLAMYSLLLHLNSHLEKLYISNKTEHFNCKGECDVYILNYLKEKLAQATDKWLLVIKLFKTIIPLRD